MGVVNALSDIDGLRATIAGIDWAGVGEAAWTVGVVAIATIGMFVLLRGLTRGLRSGLAARIKGETWLGRVFGLMAVAVFELVLMMLAWGTGYDLALSLGEGRMDLRQSLLLNAFLLTEIAKLVLRLILSPRRAWLRLPPMTDATAAAWYERPAQIVSTARLWPPARGPGGERKRSRPASEPRSVSPSCWRPRRSAIRLILRNRDRRPGRA